MSKNLIENNTPNTQWQWLIVDEDMEITGTNDINVAREAAVNSEHDGSRVIHVATGQLWDGDSIYNIAEQTTYEL